MELALTDLHGILQDVRGTTGTSAVLEDLKPSYNTISSCKTKGVAIHAKMPFLNLFGASISH